MIVDVGADKKFKSQLGESLTSPILAFPQLPRLLADGMTRYLFEWSCTREQQCHCLCSALNLKVNAIGTTGGLCLMHVGHCNAEAGWF